MELLISTPEQAECVLRSGKQVAIVNGKLGETPRALLTAAQHYLLKTDYNLDGLEPICPQALACIITEPKLRLQVIQAMVVLALSTGRLDPTQLQDLERYAGALQISQTYLKNLHQLHQNRLFLLRLSVYRNSFIGQKYQLERKRQGWCWFLKGLINHWGLLPDRSLADRYHQLKGFPTTTLGYQLWEFCQTNRYPFPGEKGGGHEGVCFHDVTHILANYDTTPIGELQTVAMTIGYKKNDDPLASLLLLLLHQHLGVQVGLLSQAATGVWDLPNVPEEFIKALNRGMEMTVDLSEGWDHWDAFNHSVADLRVRYNIASDRDRLNRPLLPNPELRTPNSAP